MDQNTELPRSQTTVDVQPPKGRNRYAVKTMFLNPKTVGAILAFTSYISAETNPLGIDPYPQLRSWIVGPPPPIEASPLSQPEKLVEEPPKSWIKDSVTAPQTYPGSSEQARNTLQWKNMVEQIVRDPKLKIAANHRQFWVNRMLQIILVESGGDPQASSGIAFGLTQLRPVTAQEMAIKYQIPKYDLNNGWDNTFLGLAHQLDLAQRYGPKLAGWAHHLGSGNMDQALKTYLISAVKLPVSEVERIFHHPYHNLLPPQYIEKYQITPDKMLNDPAVTAKLKQIGAWGDKTWEYDSRLKEAGKILKLPIS